MGSILHTLFQGFASLALILVCFNAVRPVASAQDGLRIDYEAPDACMNAARFSEELAAQLGYTPEQSSSPHRLRIRVRFEDGGFVGTFELGNDARVFRDATCREVIASIVVSLSVILEPEPATDGDNAFAPLTEPVEIPRPALTGGVNLTAAATNGTVPVRFTSNHDPFTFHLGVGSQRGVAVAANGTAVYGFGMIFNRLCTAPCTTQLEPGVHQLGGSVGIGAAGPLPELVRVDGPTHVHVDYRSRQGVRIGGWLLVLGGAALTGLGAIPLVNGNKGAGIVLFSLGGVAWIAGYVMAFTRDRVEMMVQPEG